MARSRVCVDEAAEAVVDAYRNYELVERSLAELTVVNSCYLLRQFLAWRAATGRPALEDVGAAELHEYVAHQAGRQRVGSMRPVVGVLRGFCRFLFATGVTELDLSGAVPSVLSLPPVRGRPHSPTTNSIIRVRSPCPQNGVRSSMQQARLRWLLHDLNPGSRTRRATASPTPTCSTASPASCAP